MRPQPKRTRALIGLLLLAAPVLAFADCGNRHTAVVEPGGKHTFRLNRCYCDDIAHIQRLASRVSRAVNAIGHQLRDHNMPLDGSKFPASIRKSRQNLYIDVIVKGELPNIFGRGFVSYTYPVGEYEHMCVDKAEVIAEIQRAFHAAMNKR